MDGLMDGVLGFTRLILPNNVVSGFIEEVVVLFILAIGIFVERLLLDGFLGGFVGGFVCGLFELIEASELFEFIEASSSSLSESSEFIEVSACGYFISILSIYINKVFLIESSHLPPCSSLSAFIKSIYFPSFS